MDWEKEPRSEWQILSDLLESGQTEPHGPVELLTLQRLEFQGLVHTEGQSLWYITRQGRAYFEQAAPPALLWDNASPGHAR